jgi:hypothetical protein
MERGEEKKGALFCHKEQWQRIETECKVSGQSEILWLTYNPQEIGSCHGNSDIKSNCRGV